MEGWTDIMYIVSTSLQLNYGRGRPVKRATLCPVLPPSPPLLPLHYYSPRTVIPPALSLPSSLLLPPHYYCPLTIIAPSLLLPPPYSEIEKYSLLEMYSLFPSLENYPTFSSNVIQDFSIVLSSLPVILLRCCRVLMLASTSMAL